MSDPIDLAKGKSSIPEKKPEGFFESKLGELSHKVTVAKNVWDEMGHLYQDFNKITWEETFERFKGIFVMGFLGLIMSKKEYQAWKRERKDIKVHRVESTEVAPGLRPMLPDDRGIKRSFETAEESLRKERFANMAPPTKDDYDVWYEKDGVRVKRGTKGCVKKWALKEVSKNKDPKDIPSEFAIKNGSSSLFEKTPTTYEEFEETVIKKIYPLETDRGKAIEKAAKFLSRCALGRFQILPSCHFDKMGWKVTGKEGLENMYRFIKEPQRQADLFQKIIGSTLERYNNDPIAVGISYYSGSAARAYLAEKKSGLLIEKYENGHKILAYKEGFSGKLNAEQRGGGTILSYANEVLREYERGAGLGYNIFERTAMAVEWIESKGKLMNQIFSGHPGLEIVKHPEGDHRVLKYAISAEAKKRGYLQKINPNEALVKTIYNPDGRKESVKETVAEALKFANELAEKEGFQIFITSGYRDPEKQAKTKKKNIKKRGNTDKYVAKPGESWHQGGSAVDVSLFRIDQSKWEERLTAPGRKNIDHYWTKLEKYMNAAGFVRYDAEPWHFEIGSHGWARIMKKEGIIPGDIPFEQITYKRDQLGQPSHHRHA